VRVCVCACVCVCVCVCAVIVLGSLHVVEGCLNDGHTRN